MGGLIETCRNKNKTNANNTTGEQPHTGFVAFFGLHGAVVVVYCASVQAKL